MLSAVIEPTLADYPERHIPGRVCHHPRVPGVLLVACPGCGVVAGMRVGDPAPKARRGESWRVTGEGAALTLDPEIVNLCCGWVGTLTGGVFTPGVPLPDLPPLAVGAAVRIDCPAVWAHRRRGTVVQTGLPFRGERGYKVKVGERRDTLVLRRRELIAE